MVKLEVRRERANCARRDWCGDPSNERFFPHNRYSFPDSRPAYVIFSTFGVVLLKGMPSRKMSIWSFPPMGLSEAGGSERLLQRKAILKEQLYPSE